MQPDAERDEHRHGEGLTRTVTIAPAAAGPAAFISDPVADVPVVASAVGITRPATIPASAAPAGMVAFPAASRNTNATGDRSDDVPLVPVPTVTAPATTSASVAVPPCQGLAVHAPGSDTTRESSRRRDDAADTGSSIVAAAGVAASGSSTEHRARRTAAPGPTPGVARPPVHGSTADRLNADVKLQKVVELLTKVRLRTLAVCPTCKRVNGPLRPPITFFCSH